MKHVAIIIIIIIIIIKELYLSYQVFAVTHTS